MCGIYSETLHMWNIVLIAENDVDIHSFNFKPSHFYFIFILF
jgi:hypothetical protein